MRTLIAAIVGGIVVFVWGYVAHVVVNLYGDSIKQVSGETAFMKAVESAASEPGFYVFPYLAPDRMKDADAMNEYNTKYSKGPRGLLVVGPPGEQPMGMDRMIKQIAAYIVAAFFAAMLLGGMGAGAGLLTKTVAGAALGLFAFASQDVPNWIWHGYPQSFETAQLIFTVVGWAAAGLVMSFVLTKPVKKPK